MELLKTLLWVADENAAERREQERSRVGRQIMPSQLEEQAWRATQARAQRRQTLLGDALDGADDEGEALELAMLALARGKPLTTHEVMRHLQRAKLLSVEFPAAARQQTITLLQRLRVANRVWQDPHGRWSLL